MEKTPVRMSMPPSSTTGAPSRITIAAAMIHLAWAEPDRYVARPLNANPPSTGSARAVTGFSVPAMRASGSANSAAAASGARNRANSAPSARMARVHPVEVSNDGDTLETVDRVRQAEAGAAGVGRHEDTEEPGFVQRVDDSRREVAAALGFDAHSRTRGAISSTCSRIAAAEVSPHAEAADDAVHAVPA